MRRGLGVGGLQVEVKKVRLKLDVGRREGGQNRMRASKK